MLIDEIKAELADIEGRFTTPLENLQAILDSEKARIQTTYQDEIDILETDIDGIQVQVQDLEAAKALEMVSINKIEQSLTLVATLKAALGEV